MRRGVILCGIAGWVGNRKKELQKTLEKETQAVKKILFDSKT